MKIRAELPGQDWISGEQNGQSWTIEARGCRLFLQMVRRLQSQEPDPRKWTPSTDLDHVALLLKEFILKARGEWKYPCSEDELCHCRFVRTQTVDMAILNGAHTPQQVTRQTSASSNCGTCRPEVEKLIEYRLKAS